MHACERCYSRKTKCDRRVPQCSSCLKSRSTCQYSNKRRNRQLPAEYLESLEARLNDLEQENQRLRDQRNITSPSPSATDGINGSELEITDTSLQLNVSNTRSNATDTNDAPANTSPTQSSGSLQRTPCEESRYLGSSNGVEFIDVVERAVDFPNAGGLFGRVTAYRATPTRIAVPSSLQSVTLVDASVAMPLIKSYFEHWHLTFPLLYRPSFMQMVEQMYSDTTLYRRDAACAFAFDIVLALGSIPSKRVAQYVGDAESHFVRALARLDGLSEFRDIRLLQAFLLYCKYGIHASLRDTSSEMWELLGKATQLCVELGLHNSSSAFSPKCDMHITGPLPSSIQVEMLRRCFWCYYNLERIVNISLGRPFTLHDDDIHVPLPSTLDDNDLEGSQSSADHSSSVITPFLHHIKLRRIQSKIHRSMYTSRAVQDLSLRERQAIRGDIFNELQIWRSDILRLQLPSTSKASSVVISSNFLHPSWYQALYNSACLMLFRPSTTFPAMEGHESDEEADDVLRLIWESSRQVLAKYFDLLRSRHLNYSWVCLYTIFMAGLANVYSIGCCAQRWKRGILAFLPSYLDVVSDIRDCSNILTAICEKWDDARGSCDIFNQLSMSALKELATASLQPITAGVQNIQPDNGACRRFSESIPIAKRPQAEGPVSAEEVRSTQAQHPISPGPEPITLPNIGQQPSTMYSEFDPIIDFQQLFQGLQDSVHANDVIDSNEVMQGFSQEWFGR